MKHILIVDDSKENLMALKLELEKEYSVTPVTSGKQALRFLKTKETNLVLLDIDMPEMDGFEVLENIRKNSDWDRIPVIFLTGLSAPEIEAECLARGADDFIAKPYEPLVMRRRIQRIIELYALRYRLEENLQEKKNQIGKMTLGTIITIANTVDAKDKYTGGHSIRVAEGARAIAKELAWSDEECQNIYNIAMLHDIGKIAIPDSILNKAGRLSEQEEKIMRQHPTIGYEILKDINFLEHVQDGAHYHHERWDGEGYPAGLKGEEIPLIARIICISDSYDAMNSDRVYRKKLTHSSIIEKFKEGAGKQFDPKLTALFVNMLENGYKIDSRETALENMDNIGEESLLLYKIVNEYTADLQSMADTDSLTGLYNRNYMKKKVEGMLIESEHGVFFMIDVDNFKSINDTHGHIVGDLILKMFSDVIRGEFRDADVLCRIGGDEFAVFLPGNPDRETIKKKAQDIIDGVAARPEMAHYGIKSGVSIGISTCPDDGKDFDTLYGCADKALYFVKENGKNKYHFFGNEKLDIERSRVNVDIEQIRQYLEEGLSHAKGAFTLEYEGFKKIYQYLDRYSKRNATDIQIVLFTLTESGKTYMDLDILDETMLAFDKAVVKTLRRADVGSIYSSNQYVLILMNTDRVNGETVAKRVVSKFEEISPYEGLDVSFEMESMTGGILGIKP